MTTYHFRFLSFQPIIADLLKILFEKIPFNKNLCDGESFLVLRISEQRLMPVPLFERSVAVNI